MAGLGVASKLHASGIDEVLDDECKQQAATLPFDPVLFFCGKYSVTLTDAVVHGVGSASINATAAGDMALLAFGGRVQASINNGSFVGNAMGAVVLLLGNASLVVSNSTFSGNTLNGSCISAADVSALVVDHSTFTNNTASPHVALVALEGGAALYIAGNATAACHACTITDNKQNKEAPCGLDSTPAGTGGGGFANDQAAATFVDTMFADNMAASGGAIRAQDGYAQLEFVRCHFVNNTAIMRGGAIDAGTTVTGFVSQLGSDQSVLPVRLNVSGPFGLPCDGQLVQALLNGTQVLGVNRSDSSGIALMRLNIHQPPGLYEIMFEVLPGEGQQFDKQCKPAAANLNLRVRSCIVGGTRHLSHPKCTGVPTRLPARATGRKHLRQAQLLHTHVLSNRLAAQCAAPLGGATRTSCAQRGTAATLVLYALSVCVMLGLIALLRHFAMAANESATHPAIVQPVIQSQPNAGGHVTSHLRIIESATARDTSHAGTARSSVPLHVSSLLRLLVLYMQYALILASITGVELPAQLAYPLQALAWAWSPAVPGTLSIECILPHGSRSSSIPVSVQRMLVYLAMPAVLLVLLLALDIIVLKFHSGWQASARGWKERMAPSAIVVYYVSTPTILRCTFGWFACISVDVPVAAPYVAAAQGSFWLQDPDQLCYQGYHRAWALGLGIPLLLLVCGVSPAGLLCLMLRKRQHLGDASFIRRHGLLFLCYKPSCFWWEVTVMAQTAVLIVVGVFGHSIGPLHQIIAFSCLLAVIALLWQYAQPHMLPAAGDTMLQCIVCLFVTNTVSVTFLDYGSFKASVTTVTSVGSAVLFIHVVFVASVLWRIGRVLSGKQAVENERSKPAVAEEPPASANAHDVAHASRSQVAGLVLAVPVQPALIN
ncbi:hypothetical protein COO60DRAFT_1457264 [Scenedesmus sp. NREL 46B-D3]|nr:hypothetical protein COO60DRAFT_1457264 [Scenedesmus sp. NREL 46B-D3]